MCIRDRSYIVHTAKALADVKGMTPDAFALASADNFFRLFTKVPRPEALR